MTDECSTHAHRRKEASYETTVCLDHVTTVTIRGIHREDASMRPFMIFKSEYRTKTQSAIGAVLAYPQSRIRIAVHPRLEEKREDVSEIPGRQWGKLHQQLIHDPAGI